MVIFHSYVSLPEGIAFGHTRSNCAVSGGAAWVDHPVRQVRIRIQCRRGERELFAPGIEMP